MKKIFESIVTRYYKLASVIGVFAVQDVSRSNYRLKPKKEVMDKIPVYILSYSLPVKVDLDKRKVKGVEFRPGGLGMGVNPVFNVIDSAFQKQAWLGVSEQHRTSKMEVDQKMHLIVNEGLKNFGNMEYVYLPSELPKEFYKEAANGVFWPLHHSLTMYAVEEDKSHVYELVNELMADEMIDKIKSENNGKVPKDSMVWVHDYHFQSVPKYLKEKAPAIKVGYVHHIPYPEMTTSFMDQLPQHKKIIQQTIVGILHADSIIFHTSEYKQNFIQSVKNMGIITDKSELKKLEDKIIVNPIGISKKEIAEHLTDKLNENVYDPLKYVAFTQETLLTPSDFDKGTVAEIDLAKVWNTMAGVSANTHKTQNSSKDPIADPLKYVAFPEEVSGTTAHYDKEWVDAPSQTLGELAMNPVKINIGAVSRLDYTKGIQELVEGYHLFLKQKVAEGVENPGALYQLNIVASTPRDIKAYIEYQKVIIEKMKVILEEFPGSLTFIPGLEFKVLPVNNASQDIIIAGSVKDGYLMAAPEALKARVDALNIDGLIEAPNRPSALIISEGAGVVESLKKDANNEVNIPAELSIIACSAESVRDALNTQVRRITIERKLPLERQNIEGFTTLIDRINTVEYAGRVALKALYDSKPNPLKINDPYKTPQVSSVARAYNSRGRHESDNRRKTAKLSTRVKGGASGNRGIAN